jgi:hypothetical protein
MLVFNRFTNSATLDGSATFMNTLRTSKMNRMTIAVVLAGTFMSAATAFAQSAPLTSPANAQPANQVAQVASNATSPASSAGGRDGHGQPAAGKTRPQVYQELVHAEQDGQLAYLNSTVYAHP